MGCNSSKAFKEKGSGSTTTPKSPTLVDTQRTSEVPPSPIKEKDRPPTPAVTIVPEKIAPAKKDHEHNSGSPRGGVQTSSLSSGYTYSAPTMSLATTPAYFSPPAVDCGSAGAGGDCGAGGGSGGGGGCGGDGGGASSGASAGVSGGFGGGGCSF